MTPPPTTFLEVFPSRRGRWYYRAVARNGQVIAPSQGYSRRDSARRGARRAFPTGRFRDPRR